jgi:hypothetical protein
MNDVVGPRLPLLKDLATDDYARPAPGNRSLAELEERIKEAFRQSRFQVQLTSDRHDLRRDFPPSERFKSWAMDKAEQFGAGRDGQQRAGSAAETLGMVLSLPSIADALWHSGRGEPGNTMLAGAGAIPGAGAIGRKGGKLAMDEASRMVARTSFHTEARTLSLLRRARRVSSSTRGNILNPTHRSSRRGP